MTFSCQVVFVAIINTKKDTPSLYPNYIISLMFPMSEKALDAGAKTRLQDKKKGCTISGQDSSGNGWSFGLFNLRGNKSGKATGNRQQATGIQKELMHLKICALQEG